MNLFRKGFADKRTSQSLEEKNGGKSVIICTLVFFITASKLIYVCTYVVSAWSNYVDVERK